MNENNLCFTCTPPKPSGACSSLRLPSSWQLEPGTVPALLGSWLLLGVTVVKVPEGAELSARCESRRLLPEV